jgi:hypothetical protein
MSDAPVVVFDPAKDAKFATAKRSLRENEEIIRRGFTSFVEVGNALKDVRDSGQYLEEGYETFGDYCKDRWEIDRSTADHTIGSAGVYEVLAGYGHGHILPENERQARPLAPLLRSKGEQAVRETWQRIVDTHTGDGPITAREVRAHLNPSVSVSPGQRSISDAYLTALDKVNDALRSVNWAIKKGEGRKVPRPVAERYAAYAAAADELAQAIRLAGDEKKPQPLTRIPGKGYGGSE